MCINIETLFLSKLVQIGGSLCKCLSLQENKGTRVFSTNIRSVGYVTILSYFLVNYSHMESYNRLFVDFGEKSLKHRSQYCEKEYKTPLKVFDCVFFTYSLAALRI